MTTVVISTQVISNPETGYRKQSKVYHFSDPPMCGTAPKPSSPHRKEVDEDIAIAFGRTLCGSCRIARDRQEHVDRVTAIVADVLGMGIEDLAEALPENIELRLLAHGINGKKTPMLIWTNRPPDPKDPDPLQPDPMSWASPRGTQKECYRP